MRKRRKFQITISFYMLLFIGIAVFVLVYGVKLWRLQYPPYVENPVSTFVESTKAKYFPSPTPTDIPYYRPDDKSTIVINEDPEKTIGWKTYTITEDDFGNDKNFKHLDEVKKYTFSFKYPPSWEVRTSSPAYAYGYFISLRAQSVKFIAEPVPNCPYQDCPAFGLDFKIGYLPYRVKDFDDEYWGEGHIINKYSKINVNGTYGKYAYFTSEDEGLYPTSSIYYLSNKAQLFIRVSSSYWTCTSETCQKTAKEINGILSTIRVGKD